MVGLYWIYKVLIILSAFFMNWLFEIGAGVCDMMNGCLLACLDVVLAWVGPGNRSLNRTSRMVAAALFDSLSFWAVTKMMVSVAVQFLVKRSY